MMELCLRVHELQKNMLIKIQKDHLGMEKSKQCSTTVFFWPKMNGDIEQTVRACGTCQKYRSKQSKV